MRMISPNSPSFLAMADCTCACGCGGQDLQSCVGPGHAAGKAGIVGEALLLEVLGNALAMG